MVLCHCGECRRWAGHAWAASAAQRDDLRIVEDGALRWIDSPESETHARRGFCAECGSSLFWEAPGRETISFSAGALDPPTGLATTREIYTEFADADPGELVSGSAIMESGIVRSPTAVP